MLWVGLDAPPALGMLQRKIELVVTGLGLEAEERPFAPHVTLARLKTPPLPEAIRQYMSKHAAFEAARIPVSEFVLYSSFLKPEGPFYRHEGIYRFTGRDTG